MVKEDGVENAWLLPDQKLITVTAGVEVVRHREYSNANRLTRQGNPNLQTIAVPEQVGGVSFGVRTATGEDAKLLDFTFTVAADDRRLIFDSDGNINQWRKPDPQLTTRIQYGDLGDVLSQETFNHPGEFVTLPPTWQLDEFLTNQTPTMTLAELIKCAHYARAFSSTIRPNQVLPENAIEAAIQGLIDISEGTVMRRNPLGSELQVLHGKMYTGLEGGVANAVRWLFRDLPLPNEAQTNFDTLMAA